ncbi:hypothetical protein [Nocardioides sp. Iso805N]|uniref:hypothetical protein n=1 Tax=Nocardioides sp. Iso805N TaxID=1283287 RepID=UPI00035ECAC0|nr:hypothetical protein [Nocardioides sp. Iso805N]
MTDPDLRDRYGRESLGVKILFSLVAAAMIALGAIWTFTGTGAAQTFGPILAGLGVALGYVMLAQKRH